VLPLRDNVHVDRIPYATIILIYLNIIVFCLELTLFENHLGEIAMRWALVPASMFHAGFQRLYGPPNYLSLVTHQFFHGGVLHIVANLWILWLFGRSVEDRMGPWRFAAFYLLCGVAAGVAHMAVYPHSKAPCLGASGAIYGLLGAYYLMFPFAKVRTFILLGAFPIFFWIPAFVMFGLRVFVDLVSGGMDLVDPETLGGTAWWAHFGGFGFGLLSHRLFLLGRDWRGPCDYDET
jgi:membrane associated rhomboid family serine protease